MKILAIDTSTMMSTITIVEDGKILGDFSISQEETHSEMLVSLVDRMLKDLKIKLEEIDLYAIAKGPGSFTGLRIGMASIKAMAQVFDKPIVGVSTLEAMAFPILSDGLIVPIIDARGKRFFTGIYKREDGNLSMEREDILTLADLENLLEKSEKVIFVGEANQLLSDKIKQSKNVLIAPFALSNSIGKSLCELALKRFEKGQLDSYYDLAPSYLRKSQAEINLNK